MKFLKLIQSETEIDKSLEYDVLYYNSTSTKAVVKETNPITSTTYSVKNITNTSSLPYDATSMVVSFTGVKTETYKKGQVEVTETSETETVSFEANTSSAETATRNGSFEWNEQPVSWSTTLGIVPTIKITMQDSYTDTDIIALSAEKSASVEGNIAWSCNLASDVAEINGSTLTFKQHYEGSVKLTATASNASAEKTITVTCEEVATATTYSIKANSISIAEAQPMDADSTSATVNFVGVTTQHYKLKEDYSVESNESQTIEFEANETTEVVTRNGSFEWNGESVAWEVELKGKEDPYEQYLVDLGLPSGLKWMSMNMGANEIDDHGLYFQWGATEGYKYSDKNHSSWSTAPFNNGSSDYDETYFASVSGTVCPNGVLAAEYDAATKAYGEGYRMPTKEDFEELIANTTSAWTRVGSYYTSCVKLTSKNDTSKSIIFTANGCMNNGEREYLSTYGHYWTRNFSIDYPYVGYCLLNYSARVSVYNNLGRCIGAGIRAVHD